MAHGAFACSFFRAVNTEYGHDPRIGFRHCANARIRGDCLRVFRECTVSRTDSLKRQRPRVREPPGRRVLAELPRFRPHSREAPGTAFEIENRGCRAKAERALYGRAVGARVVDREELDERRSPASRHHLPSGDEVRELSHPAASAGPQRGDGNRDAREVAIQRGEAHRLHPRVEEVPPSSRSGRSRARAVQNRQSRADQSSGMGLQRFASHSATRPQLKQMNRGDAGQVLDLLELSGAGQYAEMSLVFSLASLLCS